jgi:DNA-directed RNA polymerase subunit N (RpoN/RPB10)
MYFKCPSCRTLFANKQLPYEKGLEEICASTKSDDEKNILKEKLLSKLEIHRYCCRPRVLGSVDLIKIVK